MYDQYIDNHGNNFAVFCYFVLKTNQTMNNQWKYNKLKRRKKSIKKKQRKSKQNKQWMNEWKVNEKIIRGNVWNIIKTEENWKCETVK